MADYLGSVCEQKLRKPLKVWAPIDKPGNPEKTACDSSASGKHQRQSTTKCCTADGHAKFFAKLKLKYSDNKTKLSVYFRGN